MSLSCDWNLLKDEVEIELRMKNSKSKQGDINQRLVHHSNRNHTMKANWKAMVNSEYAYNKYLKFHNFFIHFLKLIC